MRSLVLFFVRIHNYVLHRVQAAEGYYIYTLQGIYGKMWIQKNEWKWADGFIFIMKSIEDGRFR